MMIAPLVLVLLAVPAADRADAPVILDFTAPWCNPCQQMKPAVAQLAKKGYPIQAVDYDSSPLTDRYKVRAVPTFVVVRPDGQELGRISGFRPARDIADLYNSVQDRGEGAAPAPAQEDPAAAEEMEATTRESQEAPPSANPNPYETVVRIRIDRDASGHGMVEFGSGTIIRSTPDETIILTCAHIFKVEESARQFAPKRFPFKIEVHLSDGQLRPLSEPDRKGAYRAGVHMVERHQGEAIDYDFSRDVGLIRIRPGRRLPASPVVPANWSPRPGVKMTTVGCSQGNDATAWSTWITNPSVRGVANLPNYEAVECNFAPLQGRSGGGLYTLDGYLAGVCDFAEPAGGRGLYATPKTIHQFLDRNNLTVCYAPGAGRSTGREGAMVAQNRPAPRSNRADTLRAQGPDDSGSNKLLIPSPEDLKVPPLMADAASDDGRRRRPTWTGLAPESEPSATGEGARVRLAGTESIEADGREWPLPVELKADSRLGRDLLAPPEQQEKTKPSAPARPTNTPRIWKPSRTGTPNR